MAENLARALVVDDDEPIRELFGAILAHQGFEVHFAVNGEQAVASVATAPFDLILMDFNMPILDGLAATQQIRKHEAVAGRKRAKLFIVTANGDDAVRRQARLADADGHLFKPVDLAQIRKIAEQCRPLRRAAS